LHSLATQRLPYKRNIFISCFRDFFVNVKIVNYSQNSCQSENKTENTHSGHTNEQKKLSSSSVDDKQANKSHYELNHTLSSNFQLEICLNRQLIKLIPNAIVPYMGNESFSPAFLKISVE